MIKELVPLVVPVALWGKQWLGSTVMYRCDNKAVVTVIGSRTSRNEAVMHLLRCSFFLEANSDCHLLATHILGVHNDLADDLSRNCLASFFAEDTTINATNTPEGPSVPPSGLDGTRLEESICRYLPYLVIQQHTTQICI
jgi:hypothetical protein